MFNLLLSTSVSTFGFNILENIKLLKTIAYVAQT
jgi:hypothetical protein